MTSGDGSSMSRALGIVPEPHREVARAALAAAFQADTVSALEPVAGGASGALVYAVEAGGRTALLRVETARDAFRNPHQYACMRIAAEAGVAPCLLHVDETSGVAVMDFVRRRPLAEYPGGGAALARALGGLAARLQAAPEFPALHDYPALLERMLAALRRPGLFAAGLLDRHAEAFERLRGAYPWADSASVASHNDPNPQNVLFDGERLWLIDWETAFANDPLVDVAILTDNFAKTPDGETALLEAWLGRVPDAMVRARLAVMRPITRLYYAALLLHIADARAPRSSPDADLDAPSPAAFAAAVAAGEHQPGSARTLHTLGKMLLAGFLTSATAPTLESSLEILRRG